jgi:predicted transcriptional regulator
VARAFVYHPVVDERQARLRAVRQLAGRMFEGSPSLLVLNVLDDEELDAGELAWLKKVIEDA